MLHWNQKIVSIDVEKFRWEKRIKKKKNEINWTLYMHPQKFQTYILRQTCYKIITMNIFSSPSLPIIDAIQFPYVFLHVLLIRWKDKFNVHDLILPKRSTSSN